MNFGNILKELRCKQGLTQIQLAKILGISKSNISKYEAGSVEPSIDTLNQIATHFNISVDYLLGRSDAEDSLTVNNSDKDITSHNDSCSLRYWMGKTGYGYDEIAQRLGISEDLLQDYADGFIDIPYQILISLSEICEVSTDCLLGLTEKSRKRDLDQVIPYRYNYRIAERIRKLCENNGVDINSSFFQDLLSLSEKEVFYLVEYGFIPHVDVIIKMADYFNVSTDYLLCKIEEQEEKALSSFHLLNSDNQDIIVGEIKKCIKEQKYEETVAADQPLRKAAGK